MSPISFLKSYTLPLFFIVTVLVFTACKTVAPPAPPESYQPFTIEPEVSELSVPVQIPVKSLENAANRSIKDLIYEDNDASDNMEMKVWKKDSIKIGASGNTISYKIPLKIWLRNSVKLESFGLDLAPAKETELVLAVKFKTKIDIDKNWQVTTTTQSDGYEWIEKPSLSVAGISIPLTSIADMVIKKQMSFVCKMMDDQAKKYLDVKSEMTKVWDNLHYPFKLSSQPDMWLKIIPVSLSMTPFRSNNSTIVTTIGIKAYSETALGARPAVSDVKKLPQLLEGDAKLDAFKVALLADLPFSEATSLASASLVDKEFTFGKNGKKKLTIKSLKLYGSQGNLIVETDVKGSINGKIFLRGLPVFDPATNKLSMKDFDFDLETKNALLKSADWLAHDKFAKMLAPYFEFDLTEQLGQCKQMISKSLTNNKINNNILLNGSLDSFTAKNIFITETSIKALVAANGKLQVKVSDF